MKMEISILKGKLLINGKSYSELNEEEKQFFGELIIAMKWEAEMHEYDNKQKKAS